MDSTTDAAISATGLRKDYGSVRALDGVDLTIPRGEICAVLGQNGAGKTTFIRSALGLTTPDDGRLAVLGEPAGSLTARRRMGAMLQDTDLPDLLTGHEHMQLFATYYGTPVSLDALATRTGIDAFAHKRYKSLSGGQKRRVQFAVALVGQPELLFLDEPTTGLDQEARRAVWDNVRQLAADGTTVLLTTHYLEEADALADRIVVLHNGRVIADDTTAQIRSQVGGSLISAATTINRSELAALSGVRSVSERGRLTEVLSEDAAATLRDWLAKDPTLTDLTVRKPSLQEAFDTLTGTGEDAR